MEFEKINGGWYGVSILEKENTIELFLLFFEIEQGVSLLDRVFKNNQMGVSVIARVTENGTYSYELDDNRDYVYRVDTNQNLELYPPLNFLNRKDKHFNVYIAIKDEQTNEIMTNGEGFTPVSVSRIDEVQQLPNHPRQSN